MIFKAPFCLKRTIIRLTNSVKLIKGFDSHEQNHECLMFRSEMEGGLLKLGTGVCGLFVIVLYFIFHLFVCVLTHSLAGFVHAYAP